MAEAYQSMTGKILLHQRGFRECDTKPVHQGYIEPHACVARLPGGRLGVSLGIAVAELQRPIPTAERTVPRERVRITVAPPEKG